MLYCKQRLEIEESFMKTAAPAIKRNGCYFF